ncbi:hypothetical protein BGW41_001404, partial [Actinomortierella wolfii]
MGDPNRSVPKALDQHYESHSEPKEVVDDLTADDTNNAEYMKQARIELDITTNNTHHSDCLLSMAAPYKITHASGKTSLALLTQTAAKRASYDPVIRLDPIKRPRTQTYVGSADIEIILSTSRYGSIINITDYKPLVPSFFLQGYQTYKSEIAQKLAGALIHTGSRVVLILKAEIYGRAPAEDPHSFDLVKPILDVKKRAIKRKELERLLDNSEIKKAPLTNSILSDLLQLFQPNHKKLLLIDNYDASILLTKLAETLCGTISPKNNNNVIPKIQATVDKILQERSELHDIDNAKGQEATHGTSSIHGASEELSSFRLTTTTVEAATPIPPPSHSSEPIQPLTPSLLSPESFSTVTRTGNSSLFETVFEEPAFRRFTTPTANFRAVNDDSVMYLGLPRYTKLWDITNVIHETIGLTDQVRVVRQSEINPYVDDATINFEVHFDIHEGNQNSRQLALEKPITLGGEQFQGTEPLPDQVPSITRILIREVNCLNSHRFRTEAIQVLKDLFAPYSTLVKIDLEYKLDARGNKMFWGQ